MKPERLHESVTRRRHRYSVHTLCRVLMVSESGYYRAFRAKNFSQPWQLLMVQIQEIYEENPDNWNCGVGRIALALEQRGANACRSTVRRAMKKGGLLKPPARRPQTLTKADAAAQKAENLIRRNFAAVLDCYNGEIAGLAMDDNMKKELCIRAFESACRSHHARGMILHSDRGSQFASADFRKSLARYGAVQSMSGTDRCCGGARMESFFATLKKEKLYRIQTEKMPMSQVRSVVFRYSMTYYNRERIYTANPGGLPPAMYRQAARGLVA